MLVVDEAAGHARWTGPPITYGAEYWNEYQCRRGTPIARELNRLRVEMCQRHGVAWLLDVGIGSGEFLEAWTGLGRWGWGYDVNEHAIRWLKKRGAWSDLRHYDQLPGWIGGITLWDVLEHLPEPLDLLRRLRPGHKLFVSLPIFADLNGSLTGSKHYKPGEHLHWWTEAGLIGYLEAAGFTLLEINDAETRAGREGVKSFAFTRR